MLQRNTTLSAHIVAFSRFLRTKGFVISPSREADALMALQHTDFSREQFHGALKCVFPQNSKNFLDFDALYTQYWKEIEKGVDAKIKETEEESKTKKKQPSPKKQPQPSFESLKNWLYGNKEAEEELAAFGDVTILEKKNFSTFTDEDIADSQQFIKKLSRKLALKPSRRYKTTRKGSNLDLRKTIKKNFGHGEDLIYLLKRQRKPTRIKLVLLCDVSQSMEIYSRFFVQFMFAFRQYYHRIETYVFSTMLTKISDELAEKDFKTALEKVSESTPSWAGGTAIGKCLQEFAQKDALRVLDKKSIVMIISDGLDMGQAEELEESLRTLKKRANKVVWFNPLAGNANYKPEAHAMKIAMPYLDVFASGHNLESLKDTLLSL